MRLWGDGFAARLWRSLDPEAWERTENPHLVLLNTPRERLVRLVALLTDAERPLQLIMAGKAHPGDEAGKRAVRAMAEFARREDVRDRVVFLEDHDLVLARHQAAGGGATCCSTIRGGRPRPAAGAG